MMIYNLQSFAYSKKFLSKSSKTRFNIKNVKNIITFGDSYTSSLVNYDTMEPVRDSTTSSGPNWIFYLSDILNSTSSKNDIKIYNFASGGASVTKEISPVYSDEVNTFTKQVRELFKLKMVDVKDQFPWNSKNSLFGIWFGINDTGNRKKTDDLSNEDYEAMTFLMYFRLLDELYQSGALLSGWKKIASFNTLLPKYINDFQETHRDANIFLYDAFDEFRYIRDNYSQFGIEE
ncbi:carbohydrate esterase family 16 protein, partial [Piromyces sp. E2]